MLSVRGYVGVTDGEWYQFLADRPEIAAAEINFWRAGGGRGFHALTVGEPFFFKSHSPHNRIVGGGFYSGFAALRVSEAWQFFGEANGAESLGQMRARISRYRREPIAPGEDPEIGCVFVRNVTFFPENATFAPPPGFAMNIVQGKSYDMAASQTSGYFADLMHLVLGSQIEIDFSQPWHEPDLSSAIPGSCPTGWPSRHSRRLSSAPTTVTAPSPERRSARCSRRHTSSRSPMAVRTGSITACCSGQMYTPSTTAATSPSILPTVCGSARGCGMTSATVSSTTRRPASSSSCQRENSTGHIGTFSNGT